MYFIWYNNGRKLCDGYAPTIESAISTGFDKKVTLEGEQGNEKKFSNVLTGNVMYIREEK